MTKTKKSILTPSKLSPDIYDQLINRLLWVIDLDNLNDISLRQGESEEHGRSRNAGLQMEAIQELLLSSQAESVGHAVLQLMLVGSEMGMLSHHAEILCGRLPHRSPEALEAAELRNRLRVFEASLWSAVNILKDVKGAKNLAPLLDFLHAYVSPFCDAGTYSKDTPANWGAVDYGYPELANPIAKA